MATEREETKARRARRWGWIALGAAAGTLVVVGLVLQSGLLRPRGGEGEEKAGQTGPGPGGVAADRLPRAVAEFNRAGALLEQYDYPNAAKSFEKVVGQFPDWTAARFNLGVAYLNMQEAQGARDWMGKARAAFEEVLRANPKDLRAKYCLGLYWQHVGDHAKALPYFEAVHQADPNDPHAAYKYAETLTNLDRKQDAVPILERLVASDPGFISGIYRLTMLYQQAGQPEKAKVLAKRFKELNSAELFGGAYAVKPMYGAAGKYYTALEADSLPVRPPEALEGPRILFSPEVKRLDARMKPWKWPGGEVRVPGIAVADLNGDGHLDLILAGAGEQGSTSIWWNDGKGKFTLGPHLADQVVSPCLGDVNNDGNLDLWLGRAGEDLLLLGEGKGKFTKAAYAAAAQGAGLTACARLLDIDSNGGLDLVALRWRGGSVPAAGATAPAPSVLYSNNRDGTFTEMAARLDLMLPESALAAVVGDDFDNDRDPDLVLFPAKGKPISWVNDRLGQYHILKAEATGLDVEGVVGATCGDPNKDGNRDLLVFTGKEVRLYLNRGNFRFELDREFADRFGRLGGTSGQFADIDNDGDLDIVIADAHRPDGTRGPLVLINDWPRGGFHNAGEVDPGNLLNAIQVPGDACCVVADFTGDGRLDILLAAMNEQPRLIENATKGGHYLEIDLLGTREKDTKTRSNNSAIGARVEFKTGMVIEQHVVGAPSGATAMPPLRVHAGLGPNPNVQWLRILWPDSALQAELELAADRVLKVTELNRRPSSCPHLFAWDGSRFDFVSDFGGVGGLGYMLAPGVYAPPDPTEYVRIPQLKPLGGQYVLKVLEPLEEVVYMDEVKLIAVDHPAGTEVYPNEMMAVRAAPPPFEAFCFREAIKPARAVDHRGVDVTEQIRRVDRLYAGATEPDKRFDGYAKEHFVELDFGDRLKQIAAGERLILVLDGWVEYPYSTTSFAAAQAKLRLKAPSIHALRDGRWVELFSEVGYPAGIQHTMTLDVTGRVLPSDRTIRITSNMDLYWDRIFLAKHVGPKAISLKEVAAQAAELEFLGYPREYSPDGRLPLLYDYTSIDRTVPWKLLSGKYTCYGDVTPLLHEADDCFVIMGPGDELTLRFPADAFGPVAAGSRRTFILKTDSYCKDMDLYTAHPDTVEPLPFHGMSGYPYRPDEHYPDTAKTRDYRARYNTRQVGGR